SAVPVAAAFLAGCEPGGGPPDPRSAAGARPPPAPQWAAGLIPPPRPLPPPHDSALALAKQLLPDSYALRPDERVRILRPRQLQVDDVNRGTRASLARVLDGAGGGGTAGVIVVEAEHDCLDSKAAEAIEQAGGG